MFCNTELDCYQNSIEIANFLSDPLIYICFLAIALYLKKIPGRYWLISFIGCCLATSLFYSMYAIQSNYFSTYSDYYQAYFPTVHFISKFASYILLPIFLLNLWSIRVFNISAASILFSWHGRANRRIYWCATLLNAVLSISIIYGLFEIGSYPMEKTWFSIGLMYLILVVIIGLLFWMNLMITIKRWHDLNMSGWMTLCFLVPYVGSIGCMIYLGFAKGKSKANRFGKATFST